MRWIVTSYNKKRPAQVGQAEEENIRSEVGSPGKIMCYVKAYTKW